MKASKIQQAIKSVWDGQLEFYADFNHDKQQNNLIVQLVGNAKMSDPIFDAVEAVYYEIFDTFKFQDKIVSKLKEQLLEAYNVKCYDNCGITADQYLINFTQDGQHYCAAASAKPRHPQGVWSCCEVTSDWEPSEFDFDIYFESLPKTLQEHLLDFFVDE